MEKLLRPSAKFILGLECLSYRKSAQWIVTMPYLCAFYLSFYCTVAWNCNECVSRRWRLNFHGSMRLTAKIHFATNPYSDRWTSRFRELCTWQLHLDERFYVSCINLLRYRAQCSPKFLSLNLPSSFLLPILHGTTTMPYAIYEIFFVFIFNLLFLSYSYDI